jgi:hypothetical protein
MRLPERLAKRVIVLKSKYLMFDRSGGVGSVIACSRLGPGSRVLSWLHHFKRKG